VSAIRTISIFLKQNPAAAAIREFAERQICFRIFRRRIRKYLAIFAAAGMTEMFEWAERISRQVVGVDASDVETCANRDQIEAERGRLA
jgi:hypothetical protein